MSKDISEEIANIIRMSSSPTYLPDGLDPDTVTIHGGQSGYIIWERDGLPFIVKEIIKVINRERCIQEK